MPATNVRSAVAVRPPRPMTLPRSSGWTCTSTVRPRRLVTMSTRTSSGLSTIPRTRCSTASTTTELTGGSAFGFRGGLSRRFRLGRRRRLLSRRFHLGRRRRLLGRRFHLGRRRRLLGRRFRLGRRRRLLGRRFRLGRRRRLLGRRLPLLRRGGLGGWALGGGQCGVEEVQLARLWLGPLQRALLAG